MTQSDTYPSIDHLLYFRPICTVCQTKTQLARIEPDMEPGFDLRTFECPTCNSSVTLKIEYRPPA